MFTHHTVTDSSGHTQQIAQADLKKYNNKSNGIIAIVFCKFLMMITRTRTRTQELHLLNALCAAGFTRLLFRKLNEVSTWRYPPWWSDDSQC